MVVLLQDMTFSVISFRARRLWHSAYAAAEKQPKYIKNYAKIYYNQHQIHPKSIKMDSQSQKNDHRKRGEKKTRFYKPVLAWEREARFK